MAYYTERFLHTVDGTDIWYSVTGESGPTLIFCDGLGCDGFAWKHLARLLPGHRILRWNYRGHGRSGIPDSPGQLTMVRFAEDLELVLREAQIERGVVIGHSMGAQVAFEFYKRYPERVEALVPVCGSYGRPLDTFHDSDTAAQLFPYLKAVVERFPSITRRITRALLPTDLAFQFARLTELNPYLARRQDMRRYFQHLADMDPLVFLQTLASAAEHSAWDYLPAIRVPTLVVAGELDRFTPVWLSQRMHSAIPESEMLIVPSGTHTAPVELPELIALRIERFLKDRLPEPQPARSAARKTPKTRRAQQVARAR